MCRCPLYSVSIHTSTVLIWSGHFALIKLLFFIHSFRGPIFLTCVNFMHSGLLSLDGSFPICLSVFRLVPEVVPSGPAGGQLVPQFPASREDNEVVQLHTGQQSTSAPYIHARHVVRHTETEHRKLHAHRHTDVLCFVEQKAKAKEQPSTKLCYWFTDTEDEGRTDFRTKKFFDLTRDSVVLWMILYVYLMIVV